MPTIAPGTRFGAYEIAAPLGAGGMGEVYRARDTKLGREAAIKLLPAELADDRERLGRFEQEARAASSLNHPNIVTIYEIGNANGVPYIAMELVEGRTLRQLLAPGAIPVRKLLEIGAQAADGLAKAHAAGIVHRDLKPENLMVTQDGFVKVLDFGLAKLSAHRSGDRVAVTTVLDTQPGAVMGTTYYMSPEQASGHDVDFRSDQFALGSILYEMATGRRAFQSATAAQTMAAIIQEEPESIAQLNPKVPAPLRWSIERCLAKERERRYASTTDLARDLATLRDRLSEASTVPGIIAPPKPKSHPLRLAAIAGVLLAAVVGSGWVSYRLATRPLPTFKRLTFQRGHVTGARFSPDEKTIVYSAAWGGAASQLFTVRDDSPETRALGVEGELRGLSSTGEALIFSNRTLSQVALGGGAPRAIWQGGGSGEWSPDGRQLAILKSFRTIDFPLGKRFYTPPEGRRTVFMRISPDGKRLAFLDLDAAFRNPSVVIMGLDGQIERRSRVWKEGFGLAWSEDGGEVWFTASDGGGTFDLLAMELAGRVRRVIAMPGPVVLQDIARDGRVLLTRDTQATGFRGLFPGSRSERELSWLDLSLVKDLSRDGRTVLFIEEGEGAGSTPRIYLRATDGSPAVHIGNGRASTLSPDGKWVATLPEDGTIRLIPTGAGEERTLSVASLGMTEPPAWHPDARSLLLSGKEEGHGWRCYQIAIDGGTITPLSPEGYAGFGNHAEPQLSPDGKRLLVRFRPDSQVPGAGAVGVLDVFTGRFDPVDMSEWGSESSETYWAADGRSLLSHRHDGRATEIFRYDLETGAIAVLHRFSYLEEAGFSGGPEPEGITPDGKWYVYNHHQDLNDLYLASGLK
jgi:serine/threonine protein kinase